MDMMLKSIVILLSSADIAIGYILAVLTVCCFCDSQVNLNKKVMIPGLTLSAVIQMMLTYFDITVLNAIGYPILVLSFIIPGIRKGTGIMSNLKRAVLLVFTMLMYAAADSAVIIMCTRVFGSPKLYDTLNTRSPATLTAYTLIEMFINLCALLYIYSVFYKKDIFTTMRKSDVFTVLGYDVYVFFMYLLFTTMDYSDLAISNYKRIDGLFTIISCLVIVITPYFLARNRLSAYYNELSIYQQSFLEAELNASKQYKEAQEETRAFRHDIQNNLSVVAMLLEEGRNEEALRYVNDMRSEVSALSPRVVTGDEMVDSLVSSKLTRMEEEKIKFRLDGMIEGGLDWKPMDICTVFANAIDNAVEAAAQVEQPEDRFIDLSFMKTDHHRLFRISNSCTEDADCEKLMHNDSHHTTKADKQLHGYGLKNIKRTVEKCGGMMRLSCKDKVFVLEILEPRKAVGI